MSTTDLTTGIWEAWRDYERRTGRPVRFYKAFPYVGRGCVEHDQPSYAEVEKEFSKALGFSIWEKVVLFFKGGAVRYAS